jgi:Asp-tRNA(Asn)/Glu-tRNA(Gln) amidotransferase A subunit family amidase
VTGNTRSWLALGPLTRSVRDAELVYNVIAQQPVAGTAAGGRLVTPDGLSLTMQEPCIGAALAAARGRCCRKAIARSIGIFPIRASFT